MNEDNTDPTGDETPPIAFAVFSEIGIINQLATALLAQSLPEGVHPSHFAVLNHLVRTGDGITPARIAAAMQVRRNTMTHTLKVLEQRGFILMSRNPDDARGKLVYLTETGRAFRNAAVSRVRKGWSDLIGPQERALMARIHGDLVTLRKHLDANRPAASTPDDGETS